jgi:hypothetical protein
MKNIRLKFTGLLLLLAWSSCEKVEIPDSTYTGIPFGISGKAGNEDLKLGIDQAGIKLITGAEFVEDSVWEFSGRLESSGPDGRFLSIQLRNRNEGNDPVIQWQEFASDSLDFMQEGGRIKQMHPLKIMTKNDEGLEIRSIKAANHKVQNPASDFIFLMPGRGMIPVFVEYGNGYKNGEFSIDVSPQPNLQNLFPNWVVLTDIPHVARLEARLNNTQAEIQYLWENGNQNTKHLSTDTTGIFKIEMTDTQGRKYTHSKQLLKDNSSRFFTYGNSITFKSEWLPVTTVTDKKQLRTVNITYRDRSGVIYRSNKGPQGINRFIIEEIREYEKDGRGRPTLAMKVKFTARLFSQSGDSILLENCHGWFGLGLP